MKVAIYILLSIIFLFNSCQRKRDDSPLLQGHEYKLWYIDSADKYFPYFLYIDRDGYACVLALDRELGDFVEKEDSEETGYWKLKNDSVMLLNDSRYHFKLTGRNPDTIKIRNLQRGDSMQIIDANFPPDMSYPPISWSDFPPQYKERRQNEEEIQYRYNKWGKEMVKSILLQGHDYQLWRSKDLPPVIYTPDREYITTDTLSGWLIYSYDSATTTVYQGGDTVLNHAFPYYHYYCRFVYFDKYGQMALLYLSGNGWRFLNPYDNNRNEIIGDWVFHFGWLPVDTDRTDAYSTIVYTPPFISFDGFGSGEVCYTTALPPEGVKVKQRRSYPACGDTIGTVKLYHADFSQE
jgi:hypothetical protein